MTAPGDIGEVLWHAETARYSWSHRRGSNSRHLDYESSALPTELRWRSCPAGPASIVLEPGPADGSVSGSWCPGVGSNHRHSALQADALPAELPGHRPVTTGPGDVSGRYDDRRKWYQGRGLNPRPSPHEGAALTAELPWHPAPAVGAAEKLEPGASIELATSRLPRGCSTA